MSSVRVDQFTHELKMFLSKWDCDLSVEVSRETGYSYIQATMCSPHDDKATVHNLGGYIVGEEPKRND